MSDLQPQSRSPIPNSKTVVLVPIANHIEPACERGLRELEQAGYVVRRIRGFSAIDQARCVLSSVAIREGFEETLWIDSDIAFSLADVEKLRSHQLPICCGIYPKKGLQELACHVMPGSKQVMFGAAGGLMELKYCGAGFLLVRKAVYTAIQEQLDLPICNVRFGEPLVPYFMPMIVNDHDQKWYLSEDYSFCERARQCGFQIMADSSIRLGHIGSYQYSWEDSGSQIKRFDTYRLDLK